MLIGTPTDLGGLLEINKPTLRVTCELEGQPAGAPQEAIKGVL